jgi:hypothetical protein
MSIEERFLAYAADFEVSYEDNDWSRLAQYFTDEASYDGGDGSPAAQGRDAVLLKFENAVDGLDRQMGSREVIPGKLSTEGDTVVLLWTARYSTEGLPVLEIEGTEYARFEGDRMAELRDVISEQGQANMVDWMAAHGDALGS